MLYQVYMTQREHVSVLHKKKSQVNLHNLQVSIVTIKHKGEHNFFN